MLVYDFDLFVVILLGKQKFYLVDKVNAVLNGLVQD